MPLISLFLYAADFRATLKPTYGTGQERNKIFNTRARADISFASAAKGPLRRRHAAGDNIYDVYYSRHAQ